MTVLAPPPPAASVAPTLPARDPHLERLHELRVAVERGEYRVDPGAVADAILRRLRGY